MTSLASQICAAVRRHTGSQSSDHRRLRVLDLCTGTGCIVLFLYHRLRTEIPAMHATGVDISRRAITLAKRNMSENRELLSAHEGEIAFVQDDIFRPTSSNKQTPRSETEKSTWFSTQHDILVANPPYVSTYAYDRWTSRSVRNFEPKSALLTRPFKRRAGRAKVFSEHENADSTLDGDAFYPQIIERISQNVKADVLLLEVGDMDQAERVASLIMNSNYWTGCEIWRDCPDQDNVRDQQNICLKGTSIAIKGQGNGRAVLAWTRQGHQRWLHEEP